MYDVQNCCIPVKKVVYYVVNVKSTNVVTTWGDGFLSLSGSLADDILKVLRHFDTCFPWIC
jgi:hypothetical protein